MENCNKMEKKNVVKAMVKHIYRDLTNITKCFTEQQMT